MSPCEIIFYGILRLFMYCILYILVVMELKCIKTLIKQVFNKQTDQKEVKIIKHLVNS